MKLLEAVFIGISAYAFVIWLYIVIVTLVMFPQYQLLNVSIYIPVPNDLVGDFSLPVSFVFFVLAFWKWDEWK